MYAVLAPETTFTYINPILAGEFGASFKVRTVDGQGNLSDFSDTLWYANASVGPDVRPAAFTLYPNAPNPFNAQTRIRYSLAEATRVTLSVYDVLGQHVVTLHSGVEPAGEYSRCWDGRDKRGQPVASGVYFCRLNAGVSQKARSMLLLK